MERHYHDADSLSRSMRSFEKHYGLSSEAFYEAHQADDESVAHISRYHRHVWASFYRDVQRLTENDFAERVDRALELA